MKEENENVIEENKPKKNKKKIVILIISLIIIIAALVTTFIIIGSNKLKSLPLPEVTGGERGLLGIDKNINESTLDEYLNRSDSVYRDMRMLVDPANYENIGGDSSLSGYVKGFEIVPLPYLIPVTGLPDEVGKTYAGRTLFELDENGKYIPVYKESMNILEELFPKDKVIFLMCGGGGYAGMTKAFLVSLGWDETKIYNTGGYWYYDGNNNVNVPKTEKGYDFSKVPYHEIKFDSLTLVEREVILPIYLDDIYYNNRDGEGVRSLSLSDFSDKVILSEGEEQEKVLAEADVKAKEYGEVINEMLKNRESFVMSVFPGDFCYGDAGDSAPAFLGQLAFRNNFYYYSVGLLVYKNSDLYKQVKYAPTIIIVYKGKIIAYLDNENDDHIKLNESEEEFDKWFTSYVHVKK